MGRFESSDSHGSLELQPLRVPQPKGDMYSTAKELVEALPDWSILSENEEQGLIVCERKARALSAKSKVTIKIEGPDGIPSTTVTMVSESEGGLLGGDKKNVNEFMKLYRRRVV
jgi:hypothetical protein